MRSDGPEENVFPASRPGGTAARVARFSIAKTPARAVALVTTSPLRNRVGTTPDGPLDTPSHRSRSCRDGDGGLGWFVGGAARASSRRGCFLAARLLARPALASLSLSPLGVCSHGACAAGGGLARRPVVGFARRRPLVGLGLQDSVLLPHPQDGRRIRRALLRPPSRRRAPAPQLERHQIRHPRQLDPVPLGAREQRRSLGEVHRPSRSPTRATLHRAPLGTFRHAPDEEAPRATRALAAETRRGARS